MPEEISSLCYLNNGLYFEPPREQFYMRINNRDNNASIKGQHYIRESSYEVFITAVADPSSFYVTKTCRLDAMNDLKSEILALTNRLDGSKQMADYSALRDKCQDSDEEHEIGLKLKEIKYQSSSEELLVPYDVGMLVLTYVNAEERWFRGKILGFTDNEGVLSYDVFLVDYGECLYVDLKCIRPLPISILNQIKFQSIFCSLHGIRSTTSEGWTDNDNDKLWDMTRSQDLNTCNQTTGDTYNLEVVSPIASDISTPDTIYNVILTKDDYLFPLSIEFCILGNALPTDNELEEIYNIGNRKSICVQIIEEYMKERKSIEPIQNLIIIENNERILFVETLCWCVKYITGNHTAVVISIINGMFNETHELLHQDSLRELSKSLIELLIKRFKENEEFMTAIIALLFTISSNTKYIHFLMAYGLIDTTQLFLMDDVTSAANQSIAFKIFGNYFKFATSFYLLRVAKSGVIEKFNEYFFVTIGKFLECEEFSDVLFQRINDLFEIFNYLSLFDKTKSLIKYHYTVKPLFKLLCSDLLNQPTFDDLKENILKLIVSICKTNLFYKQILFSTENIISLLQRFLGTIVKSETLRGSIRELIQENFEFHHKYSKEYEKEVSKLPRSTSKHNTKKLNFKKIEKHKIEITSSTQPTVKWFQTKSNLLLTVQLSFVNEFDDICKIDSSSIDFKARVESCSNFFKFQFYDEIDNSKTKIKVNYSNVLIGLRKKKFAMWPRVTKEKIHMHYIVNDFDKLTAFEDNYQSSSDEDHPKDPLLLAQVYPQNDYNVCFEDINQNNKPAIDCYIDSDNSHSDEEQYFEDDNEHNNNEYCDFHN